MGYYDGETHKQRTKWINRMYNLRSQKYNVSSFTILQYRFIPAGRESLLQDSPTPMSRASLPSARGDHEITPIP